MDAKVIIFRNGQGSRVMTLLRDISKQYASIFETEYIGSIFLFRVFRRRLLFQQCVHIVITILYSISSQDTLKPDHHYIIHVLKINPVL